MDLYPGGDSFVAVAQWDMVISGNGGGCFLQLAQAHIVDSLRWNGSPWTGWTRSGDTLWFPCPAGGGSSDTGTLTIWYRGGPYLDPSTFGGLYFSGNFIYNIGVGLQAIPHSFGRAWFPVRDTFPDKFTATLHFTIDSGWIVVASGMFQGMSCSGGRCQWNYEVSFPVPAYLLAFASSPSYVILQDSVQDTISGVWTPVHLTGPASQTSAMASSFSRLDTIFHIALHWFGKHFFPRIGYNLVPFPGGAMEHPTAIAISTLLIDGTRTAEPIIAHELAHHWFGDLVTLPGPSAMWWQEGGPTYFEYLYRESLGEMFPAYMDTLLEWLLRMLPVQDGAYLYPDHLPQNRIYGTTAYQKGAWLHHALRLYIDGPDFLEYSSSVYRSCLRSFFSTYPWQSLSDSSFTRWMESCARERGNLALDPGAFQEMWVHRKTAPSFVITNWSVNPVSAPSGASSLYEATVQILRTIPLPDTGQPWRYSIPVWLAFTDTQGQIQTIRRYLIPPDTCVQIVDTVSFLPGLVAFPPAMKGYDANFDFLICETAGPFPRDTFLELSLLGKIHLFVRFLQPGCVYLQHVWGQPFVPRGTPAVFRFSPVRFWVLHITPGVQVDSITLLYDYSSSGIDRLWVDAPSVETQLSVFYQEHPGTLPTIPSVAVDPGISPADGRGKIQIPFSVNPGIYVLGTLSAGPPAGAPENPLLPSSCPVVSSLTGNVRVSEPRDGRIRWKVDWLCGNRIRISPGNSTVSLSGPVILRMGTPEGREVFRSAISHIPVEISLPAEISGSSSLLWYQILANHEGKRGEFSGSGQSLSGIPGGKPLQAGLLYAPQCKRE